MESMYCWPSVSIKRRASLVIARKIIKAKFEWTFGYLLTIIDSSFLSETVARVITSKNNQFIDPVHEVSMVEKKFFSFCLPTNPIFTIFCPRNIK